MGTAVMSPAPAPDRHADYNKTRLFLVSCLALTMAGINNSMRANTADGKSLESESYTFELPGDWGYTVFDVAAALRRVP